MRRVFVLSSSWWFVIALACTACEVSQRAPGGERWGNRGAVASLDDVTNGLVNNHPAPSAGKQLAGFDDFGARKTGEASESPVPPKAERLLIQRGAIHIEVARPEDAQRAFVAKVQEWGGYLQNQAGTTLTVRLPAAKFDEAFALARSSGRVLTESREADDVTEEYVDLGIRLDNAKKSRDRLLEILQKADKVEDILKVEAELRRLTEEIERMEGRRKFLADRVAMATLTIGFHAAAEAPAPAKRARQHSRFDWINRVGAESMLGDF